MKEKIEEIENVEFVETENKAVETVASLKLTTKLLRARRDVRQLLNKTGVADASNKNMGMLAGVCTEFVQEEIGSLMGELEIKEFDEELSGEESEKTFKNIQSQKLFETAQMLVFIEILSEQRFLNMTKKEKNELAIFGYVKLKKGKTHTLCMSVLGFILLRNDSNVTEDELSNLDKYETDLTKLADDFELTKKKKGRFGL